MRGYGPGTTGPCDFELQCGSYTWPSRTLSRPATVEMVARKAHLSPAKIDSIVVTSQGVEILLDLPPVWFVL